MRNLVTAALLGGTLVFAGATAIIMAPGAGAATVGASVASIYDVRTSDVRTSDVRTSAVSAPAVPASAHSGQTLKPGIDLRSPNGDYLFTLSTAGRLSISRGDRTIWATSPRTTDAKLVLRTDGNVAMVNRRYSDIWQTGTWHAGSDRLTLTDSGVLTLTGDGGTVWSSALGNGCVTSTPKHRVIVSITQQHARLCEYGSQILVTSVTTGASSIGDATPTGTWQVYEKLSPTTLYPAGGGAYHVKYWMPYSGAYGMHDSPWQKFAYGSSKYKTEGSHGCVHFPAAAMARLYSWAPVGTTVTIHS
jgi:hypothetical protein